MTLKTENIQIKVTPEEKKRIMINAARKGLKLSAYIRMKCLEKWGGKTNERIIKRKTNKYVRKFS